MFEYFKDDLPYIEHIFVFVCLKKKKIERNKLNINNIV